MKNEQWEAIHVVFDKMEQLCGQLKSPESPLSTASSTAESGGPPHEEEVIPAGDEYYDIVEVRAEIRTQLDFLRVKLAEQLTERDCYLVVFSIVAYFDEHVQTSYLDENQMSWPPLQQELFQVDDAGEVFYDIVDDILRKPQTLPFIYEIYYFCLSKGFRGKYVDNPVKINEYMKKLQEKIPVADLTDVHLPPEDTRQIKPVGSFIWYYAAAVAVLVVGYFLLHASANYWDSSFVQRGIDDSKRVHQERTGQIRTPALPAQKDSMPPSAAANQPKRVPIRPATDASPPVEKEGLTASLQPELETKPRLSGKPGGTRGAPAEIFSLHLDQPAFIYTVQVGAFRNRKNAVARVKVLQGRSFDAWADLDTPGGWHKVFLGKYKNRKEARAVQDRLRERKEFQDALQVEIPLNAPAGQSESLDLQQNAYSKHDE